jgi:MarR-like DNA-binding transcriptional regulator SgrR of sgrS sRNA
MNPKLGGAYGWMFDRVASISATSQDQVAVTLKQPDYWLENELSPVCRAWARANDTGSVCK